LYITSIEKGSATGTLYERFWIKNPFNSIHAAALINAGEAVSGLAMISLLESQTSPKLRGIPVSLRGDYRKKAKGVCTVHCVTTLGKENNLIGEKEIHAEIRDKKGDLCCIVTAVWKISEVPQESNKIK
jgi:acyl-coenzyme A thioesterase PaaI-like protein